jgi:hypothetical protein
MASAGRLLFAAACARVVLATIEITVSESFVGSPRTASFIGFSGSEATLGVVSAVSSAGDFTPRPSFARLMKLLGGGSGAGIDLRFGHFWASPSGVRPHNIPVSYIEVNASTGTRINDALALFNGTVTADIPPVDTSDADFVSITGAALAKYIAPLTSIELANEPDISSFRGNYTGYVSTLRLWLAGLAAEGLTRIVDAPVIAAGSWWPAMPAFLAEFAPQLHAFVQHRYGLSACSGHALTPEQLMNASTTWVTANDTALLSAVAAAGLPFVLGEGNTVSCNGYHGVSDVFASALYAVDAMYSAWSAGITGFKWHGLGLNVTAFFYQPVYYDPALLGVPGLDTAQPRPLFLGLWAFAEAAPAGSRLLALNATNESQLVRAWASLSPAGAAVTVSVLNKLGAEVVPALVRPAAPCAPGTVATLVQLSSGPAGLAAATGSSYANLTFDGTTDGVPVGTRAGLRVPCVDGAFAFDVPAASGAFLTYDA